MANHDILVIGTSAGGVDALMRLIPSFPADLPAAVFVVIHMPQHHLTQIDRLLDASSPLHVHLAQHGDPVRNGSVLIARPGRHLVLRPGHVHLGVGPPENFSRPAVDPLFRSAALAYGPRVVGVVLTGALDDGASGLAAIEDCGGIAVVQDPRDAAYPEMPRNAIRATRTNHVSPLVKMSQLLQHLIATPANKRTTVPRDLETEIDIAEGNMTNLDEVENLGTPVPFVCPECGGSLYEMHDANVHRYRCRVGHAHTDNTLLADQSDRLENTLWNALRTIREQRQLLESLSERARQKNRHNEASSYEEKLAQLHARETHIRSLLPDDSRETA